MDRQLAISDTYLVVDSRERAVIPFIETIFQEHAYVVKQVTTADFLICRQGQVLAAFERKTHVDFAASFKDGRHDNVKKLCALRDTTGCQLFYIIEGPAFPSLNRKFARIPFSNILAAITNLMVRNGIFMIHTEDPEYTAQRILDFIRVFATQPQSVQQPQSDAIVPQQLQSDAIVSQQPQSDAIVPEILTARVEETDEHAIIIVWARLRGISIVLGKILSLEFTIAELASGAITEDHIKSLKTFTGRTINKDAVLSLTHVARGSSEHSVKLLSGLRNITPAVAVILIDAAGGLAQLCLWSNAAIADIKIPRGANMVCFGKTRADRVHRILHYRVRQPLTDDEILLLLDLA